MSLALISTLVALIDSRIAAHSTTGHNPNTVGANNTLATPTPAPAADPFGGLSSTGTIAGTAAPVVEVTPIMIQQLIVPLLSNEAAKARLSAAMQELGIPELPAARPDQLPALYAKFKAIADEVNGAAPAAASGGMTII